MELGKQLQSAYMTMETLKKMNKGESMIMTCCPDGYVRVFECVEVRNHERDLKGGPLELSSGFIKALSAEYGDRS